MFAYTSANTGVDYLTEIDIGIWEQRLDDEAWAAWVEAKREIAAVALANGGSISACHGSCREGEVDLVPQELGRGFEVMLDVKRTLDPNNIMNPGKYLLDQAYERDAPWLTTTTCRPGRPASPYRWDEQLTPPPAVRASEVAQTTFEHVYEVDPRLMQRQVLQQEFPNWDTLRIMRSRQDHLAVDAPALRRDGHHRVGAPGRDRARVRPPADDHRHVAAPAGAPASHMAMIDAGGHPQREAPSTLLLSGSYARGSPRRWRACCSPRRSRPRAPARRACPGRTTRFGIRPAGP